MLKNKELDSFIFYFYSATITSCTSSTGNVQVSLKEIPA